MDEPDYSCVIESELEFHDTQSLNRVVCNKDFNILYVNIRGLKTNFKNLEVFIEMLCTKPDLIVCSESRYLEFFELYNLTNYKLHYNHSYINKADGVVVYVNDNLTETTKTEIIDNVIFMNTNLSMKGGANLNVTSLYRCHDMNKLNFVKSVNSYIKGCRQLKNHLIIGDFNIDLKSNDEEANTFLNNFFRNWIYTTIHWHYKAKRKQL